MILPARRISLLESLGARVWLLLLLVGTLGIAVSPLARSGGDSPEYVAYSFAIARSFTPWISEGDYQSSREIHSDRKLLPPQEAGRSRQLAPGSGIDEHGFIRLSDGRLLTWHFWLYSALVAPLLPLVEFVGLKAFSGFVVFNGACIGLALAFIWFRWPLTNRSRHAISALLLSSCTLVTLIVPGPDLFVACLVFIAVGELRSSRPGMAALAAGAASAQAPPMVLLLGVAIVKLALDMARSSGRVADWRDQWRDVALSVVGVLLGFAPPIFFLVTLGVANPILTAGAAQWELASINRLWVTFFDPSMGMIVGSPGVLLLAMVMTVAQLRLGHVAQSTPSRSGLLLSRPWLGFVLLTVAMAWMTLPTVNFNHGYYVFSRYAFWLVPVLLAAAAFELRAMRPRARYGLLLAAFTLNTLTSAYAVLGGRPGYSYLAFRPWVSWQLAQDHPWYLPHPELFAERIAGYEMSMADERKKPNVFVFRRADGPHLMLLPEHRAPDFMAWAATLGCQTEPLGASLEGWVYLRSVQPAACSFDVSGHDWLIAPS
jgi:hypothetical protein